MRPFPSIVALFGVLLAGAGLFLSTIVVDDDPPVARTAAAVVPTALQNPSLSLSAEALAPWHQSRAPVREAAVPTPAPAPAPVRSSPNDSALTFLGKVVTEDKTIKYFFKEKSTGLVLGLTEGTSRNGWTLSRVDDLGYHLEGPGGSYEVRP